MRTFGLSYNFHSRGYLLVDNPEPSTEKGRMEFHDISDLANAIKNLVEHRKGKKICLNIERETPDILETDLVDLLSKDYKIFVRKL